MRVLMITATALTVALVLFIVGYVLVNGIPNITWELLSTKPSYLNDRVGILPDILNTIYIVIATLIVVLPLGVGAAIYLTEYAKNKKIGAAIEYAAETLSGIPSIIYGLVGMLIFANNFGTSLLAGALTLVIMNLPTIMRTTQESLKTVPQSYRESDTYRGIAGVGGRYYYRLHTCGGKNTRRIGGSAVYGGYRPQFKRYFYRYRFSGFNLDGRSLRVCEGRG